MNAIADLFLNILKRFQNQFFDEQAQTFLIEFSQTFTVFLILVFIAIALGRYLSLFTD